MRLKLIVNPEAEADLSVARQWYDEKRAGLGDRFLRSVEAVLESICDNLEAHAVVYRDLRMALVRRFPYAVIYRMGGTKGTFWFYRKPECPLFLFYKLGIPPSKVQEVIGEMGLALTLRALGFKVSPFDIHATHGPDQIAKQTNSGIWGIFEAKGGPMAKLGNTDGYGTQMGGKWISHWINQVINKNGEDADSLAAAYGAPTPMLAGVVKFVLPGGSSRARGVIRFAFHAYDPPSGTNMGDTPWLPILYNPTPGNF